MSKRLLAVFLTLTAILGLASCGGKVSQKNGKNIVEYSNFLVYEIAKTDEGTLSLSVIGIKEDTEKIETISVPPEVNVFISEEDHAILTDKGYLEKECDSGIIHFTNETLPENAKELKLPVTEISILAFSSIETLENVYLPDTIVAIGGEAMSNCTSLKSVSIPQGVRFISCSLFDGCSSLESVNIPRSVMAIEDSVFKGCEKLQTINYGGSKQDWRNVLIFEKGNEQVNKVKIIYTEN